MSLTRSLDEMTCYKLSLVIPVKNLTFKVDWIGKKWIKSKRISIEVRDAFTFMFSFS